MNVLALALALASYGRPGPPMIVDGVSFQVTIHARVFDNCSDAAKQLSGKEIAESHIFYTFGASADPGNPARRLISVTVDTNTSFVEMPDISWPNMSPSEVDRVERMRHQLAVHERGHLAIAVQSAAEMTAQRHTVPILGNMRAELAPLYKSLDNRQIAYDKQTSHGMRQSAAPAPLRGQDVSLTCTR